MAKPLDTWLASKFEPPHLAATIDELTAAASTPPEAGTGDDEIKAKLDDCDRKLTQYRAVLSAGAASVAHWFTQPKPNRLVRWSTASDVLGVMLVARDADPLHHTNETTAVVAALRAF
jgi:hypothetical protein